LAEEHDLVQRFAAEVLAENPTHRSFVQSSLAGMTNEHRRELETSNNRAEEKKQTGCSAVAVMVDCGDWDLELGSFRQRLCRVRPVRLGR
jgi:hypothetical protein